MNIDWREDDIRTMKFEDVLPKLRDGQGAAFRKAWRPKVDDVVWLYVDPPKINGDCALMLDTGVGFGEWQATSQDILADDWFYVSAIRGGA